MKPFVRIGEYVYRLVEPSSLVLYQGSVYRVAGKKEDLIESHPELEAEIKELSAKQKAKYLEWGVKQLAEGSSLEDLLPTLETFDKFSSKFKHRDIYQYDLDALKEEIKELSEHGALVSKREKRKKSKATGAKKIYEDENLLLIRIDSKRACVEYGKGTKWCITMEGTTFWGDYRERNVIFYYLFVGKEKYAIAFYREDNTFEFFDAKDYSLDTVPHWDKLKPLVLKDAPKAPNKNFLATDPKTSPEILKELAKEDEFKISVARNPSTPPETLKELSGNKDQDVRVEVAANPSTPPEALKKLARDRKKYIRSEVAKNPSTPLEVLKKLAKDENGAVRQNVAWNPATPTEILIELAKDEDSWVRLAVAWNPATPTEILIELAKDEESWVRIEVVKNPATPTEILIELAKDEEYDVRQWTANNPSTPLEALKELAKDENSWVRKDAEKALKEKEK